MACQPFSAPSGKHHEASLAAMRVKLGAWPSRAQRLDPCVRPASHTACYMDSLRIQMTEQDGRMVTGLHATGTDGRTEQELRRRLAHTLFISAT
jgi:hypothetical protein